MQVYACLQDLNQYNKRSKLVLSYNEIGEPQ